MAKRGSSNLHFVIGLNKPQGYSSHDAVSVVKRCFKEKRCGHTGTLDPLATGVLSVCVGSATRLNQVLEHDSKSYQVRIIFGLATTSLDADGDILPCTPAPPCILDKPFIESSLKAFIGPHMQTPPSYSALKIQGRRAYDLARKGEDLHLEPRPIEVYSIKLLGYGLHTNLDAPFTLLPQLSWKHQLQESYNLPFWDLEIEVSKGTYIRALARDIAKSLNTGAHVAILHRTRVGELSLKDCVSLELLEAFEYLPASPCASDNQNRNAASAHDFALQLRSLDCVALTKLSSYSLNKAECQSVVHGNAFSPNQPCNNNQLDEKLRRTGMVSLVYEGKLMALAQYIKETGIIKPQIVFPHGVERESCFRASKKSGSDLKKARELFEKRTGRAPLIFLEEENLAASSMDDMALAWGVFDGLHKGHRDLINSTRKYAQEHSLLSGLITFDRDPDELFNACDHKKLMSNRSRLNALAQTGVDAVFVVPFTKTLSQLDSQAFLEKLFAENKPASIHVGENFCFGHKAQGTTALLDAWACDKGIQLFCRPLLQHNAHPISSSRIRRSISNANMCEAREMLGSSVCMKGRVVHGRAQGRLLGFPTANIACDTSLIKPARGVYSGLARGAFGIKPCAVSVGIPPHFSQEAVHDIEAHLLDFDGDLYDTELEIEFLDFLRHQKQFESLDALKAAISEDVAEVRRRLKNFMDRL